MNATTPLGATQDWRVRIAEAVLRRLVEVMTERRTFD